MILTLYDSLPRIPLKFRSAGSVAPQKENEERDHDEGKTKRISMFLHDEPLHRLVYDRYESTNAGGNRYRHIILFDLTMILPEQKCGIDRFYGSRKETGLAKGGCRKRKGYRADGGRDNDG